MDTSEQMTIEVASQVKKRQKRSVEEKRRIVEETLVAGASVARVARRHAVNANQVFYWRKKYHEGQLGKGPSSKLLPVTLSDSTCGKSASLSVRRALPEHLPREVRKHLPKQEACPDCGGKLKHLGEDVSEILEYVPASLKVIQYVRPKLACACCDRIVQAEAPSRPIR